MCACEDYQEGWGSWQPWNEEEEGVLTRVRFSLLAMSWRRSRGLRMQAAKTTMSLCVQVQRPVVFHVLSFDYVQPCID